MNSEEPLPYSPVYIVAWTTLSVVVTVFIFFAYAFGTHLLNAGHWIWDLVRYFAKPII
jgi:hypothetical protein